MIYRLSSELPATMLTEDVHRDGILSQERLTLATPPGIVETSCSRWAVVLTRTICLAAIAVPLR